MCSLLHYFFFLGGGLKKQLQFQTTPSRAKSHISKSESRKLLLFSVTSSSPEYIFSFLISTTHPKATVSSTHFAQKIWRKCHINVLCYLCKIMNSVLFFSDLSFVPNFSYFLLELFQNFPFFINLSILSSLLVVPSPSPVLQKKCKSLGSII